MKRILVFLLVLGMVFAAVGCSPSSAAKVLSEIQELAEKAETGKSEPKAANAAQNEPKAVTADDEPEAGTETAQANIQEIVILDENGVKITAKGLDYDGWMGPELKLLVENDREENITVQARSESCNGIMIDTILSVDVAAGKKANDTMTLMDTKLKEAGITTIKELAFQFHVYDSESYDDLFDSALITLRTDTEDFEQPIDDSGVVAYEGNGIRIVAKDCVLEDIGYTRINLYIENNSARNITVQVRDESVNGFMVDALFSADVRQGCKAFTGIRFDGDDLAENGITELQEVSFRFHVYDSELWDTLFDSEEILLSVE